MTASLSEPGITCEPQGDGLKIHQNSHRRKLTIPFVTSLVFTAAGLGAIFAPSGGVVRITRFAVGAFALTIGAILLWLTLYLRLVTQDVTISRDSILIERRFLFYRWQRKFPAADIAEVSSQQEGQAKTSTGGTQIFYGVRIKTRNGNTDWITASMVNQDYAISMAQQINAILGLRSPQS